MCGATICRKNCCHSPPHTVNQTSDILLWHMTPHLSHGSLLAARPMIVYAGPFRSDVVWCNPIHVQLDLSRGWGKAKVALPWLTDAGKPSKSWQCVALPHHAWRWDDRLLHGRQREAPLVLPKSHPCSYEHLGFRWLWPGWICNLGTPWHTLHHPGTEPWFSGMCPCCPSLFLTVLVETL